MKQKLITQKIYKNPDSFLYSEPFSLFVNDLEKKGQLNTLPQNLYVYHVLSILFGEVNNGGFAQYLSNSDLRLFSDLSSCAKAFAQPDLITLIEDFTTASARFFPQGHTCANAPDYDDDFEKLLDEYDDRFYSLDEKLHFDKLLLKYYKDNFSVNSIKYYAVKECPSDTCSYFTFEGKYGVSAAVECFFNHLSEYESVWDIVISETFTSSPKATWFKAVSDRNCIDLRETVAHFADEFYSFAIHGKTEKRHDRKGIASFAAAAFIAPAPEEDTRPDMYELQQTILKKSFFEENEYIMKTKAMLAWFKENYTLGLPKSSISILTISNEEFSKEAVLSEFLKKVRDFKNIRSISEQIMLYTPLSQKTILHYQR